MNERKKRLSPSGSIAEVFVVFLKLGVTSFGGPIAHLAYFKKELVDQRQWISEDHYGQLLAISQFLPGPASSQVGFCLGLFRAGWLGALAAFFAFTFPSALLLVLFAKFYSTLSSPLGEAIIHGLKLVACAVVADAVLGMAKKLCTDITRKIIALLSLALLLFFTSVVVQLVVILFAAIFGAAFIRNIPPQNTSHRLTIFYSTGLGSVFVLLFLLFLVGLPLLNTYSTKLLSVVDIFYRAGAFVFGGGHVVLPLLESEVVTHTSVNADQFLAGYGAAQAIPGPLFSFSAFLGSIMSQGAHSWLFAATALGAIFLPGFLLVAGILPFWQQLARHTMAASAIAGINAAVVGLLAAALYNPIITSGITSLRDMGIALVGFGLLSIGRLSPLIVVAWCTFASVLTLRAL